MKMDFYAPPPGGGAIFERVAMDTRHGVDFTTWSRRRPSHNTSRFKCAAVLKGSITLLYSVTSSARVAELSPKFESSSNPQGLDSKVGVEDAALHPLLTSTHVLKACVLLSS